MKHDPQFDLLPKEMLTEAFRDLGINLLATLDDFDAPNEMRDEVGDLLVSVLNAYLDRIEDAEVKQRYREAVRLPRRQRPHWAKKSTPKSWRH